MSSKDIIATARLTIGSIREGDFDALIAIFKHEQVSKTYMVPTLKTLEEERRLFDRILEMSHKTDRYVYGVFLDNQLIGFINDTEIAGSRIELGYALDPAHFSKGYMTEALKAIIQHLFDNGFEEVLCGAFETNLASIRVMEKCGMSRLDRTESIEYRDQVHPCVFYSIKK